ncbi:MAG: hypothetical protein H6562_10670 [Lewinellaceae bacterium]|nr:hypothetical protein [Lewinellaceae bacterium]
MKSLKLFLPCVALLFLSACQKSVPAPESLTSEPVLQKISGPSTQELNGLQNPEAAGQVDPDIEEFISFMENAIAFTEKFNNLDTLTGFDIRKMALDEEHYDVNYIEAHLSATSFNSAAELVDEFKDLITQAIDVNESLSDIPESERLNWILNYLVGSNYVANCNQDYTNCMLLSAAQFGLTQTGCLILGATTVIGGVICYAAAVTELVQDQGACNKDLSDCIKNQNQ